MPAPLGIHAHELWAYQRNRSHPLEQVLIIDPGINYESDILVRMTDHPARYEFWTTRAKLKCRWDLLDDYLATHHDIPRGDEIATPAEPVHIVHTTNELREIIREELEAVLGGEKVAYTTTEAARAVGLSPSSLQLAVSLNQLVPHYFGKKRLFTAAELLRWIESLPEEPSQPRRY